MDRYLDVRLHWDGAGVRIGEVHAGRLPKPARVPLYRGRFRARVIEASATDGGPTGSATAIPFDFPLLADADPGEEAAMNQLIRKNVRSATTVRLPLAEAGAPLSLVVVDTRTGKTWRRALQLPPPDAR